MDELTGVLAATRVRNLLLAERRASDPHEAVGTLLAVQAQEFAFSRWSVGQRTVAPEEGAVITALASGAIVRTHVLRPTWHYVRGEDLRWLQALTGGRVRQLSAGWYRAHELDQKFLAKTRELIEGELVGGRSRTRKELKALLERAGLDVGGQRMAGVLFDLELGAVVCSGPPKGKQHTYALVDEHLPPTPTIDAEEATCMLVRRYLAAHGPATLKDLRWWSTLTLGQLRRGVEALGDELERASLGDVEYLLLARDPPFAADGDDRSAGDAPAYQLLQVFDELFVGYAESRGLVDPDGEYGAVLPIGFSKMMHVVLEGERLAGRWRTDRLGGGLKITVALDRPLAASDVVALEAAAAAYGSFYGKCVEVEVLEDSTR